MQKGCSWCIGGFCAGLSSELAASSDPTRGEGSPGFGTAMSVPLPTDWGPPATGCQAAMSAGLPSFRRSSTPWWAPTQRHRRVTWAEDQPQP